MNPAETTTTEKPALDPRDEREIRRVLGPYLERIEGSLILFGSRARGDHRAASDIDLAIRAKKPIPAWVLAEMREGLEESGIPFRVDLVDYRQAPEALKHVIEKEGIPWPT